MMFEKRVRKTNRFSVCPGFRSEESAEAAESGRPRPQIIGLTQITERISRHEMTGRPVDSGVIHPDTFTVPC
jgi:hypothetical protein